MKEIVDLHTHTTFSDGTYAPDELVAYAKEKGLYAIAITDHDTLEGVKSLQNDDNDIEIIAGVEISADYMEKEVHMVGIYIDIYDKGINEILAVIREKRHKRNLDMIDKLAGLGIEVTLENLREQSRNAIVSRSHFAKWLTQNGYAKEYREAFKNYLEEGKPAYVKREIPDFEKAAEIIKDAGGIPILAHPFMYKMTKDEIEQMAKDMKKAGVEAIECYYPTHSPEDTKFILSVCERNGLKPSGGSDFHGSNKPNLDLAAGYGDLIVEKKILDDLVSGRL